MDGAGCWSTVVCTPQERAALGLTAESEWLLTCRLGAGHRGNHATDASSGPRADRRLWLEWNDFDDHAQSLIERNPCSTRNGAGASCLYFEGHGGPHFYAQTNGHAPAVIPGASAPGSMNRAPQPGVTHRPPAQQPAPIERFGPATPTARPPISPEIPQQATVGARTGGHRLPSQPPQQPAPGVRVPGDAVSGDALSDADRYRGGRRSTNVDPPSAALPRTGRRHRLPDADIPEQGGRGVEAPTPPRHPVGAPEPRSATGDTRVADALTEVAAALTKLAEALRPR